MKLRGKRWLDFYPDDVNPNLEIKERTISELLSSAVKKYGDEISLQFENETWSYKEVQDMSEKLAGSLFQLGLEKSDRLSIMLPNCAQYVFSVFGVVRLGGIVVQTNPMYVERELEYQLNDTEAEFMICHDSVYERVKKIQPKTSLKKIIVVQFTEKRNIKLDENDMFLDDLINTYHSQAPNIKINPNVDIAVLQYTGGTTGRSKGVMLTHQNFVNQVELVNEFLLKEFKDDETTNRVVISFLPLFHIFGLASVTMSGYLFGYKQIILPRFETETVLNFIKKEKPIFFFGVPTMFTSMLHFPNVESYGLEHIKVFFCGSSPMPLETYTRFKKLMGKQSYLSDGYGLSEMTSGAISNPHSKMKIGSVGIPLPLTEAKVVIETDNGLEEAPLTMKGEIVVRGPQLMKGYWKNLEETEIALRNGWMHTGDIGYMDEDGYFYIVDRKKDMIIASGYNVYPREVEEVIYQIPQVKEAIVIGIPDEYRGETVKAYITLKENQTIQKEEVIAFCRKNLAAYKVPRLIEFRDNLPKSSVGKLLKRELRDQELSKLKK
ncbi:long-chain fatty acid--CoA ligase [Oceanobacillus sp. Castelsardo]|uniref:long-chain-fatty-acid--CoA ligase n=1 Tax=Oceanobacillus sp. Castelsardo TaxID=1851204 RepID=UPI000838BED8|nr:long-chain fatty acid--CoA ligase [Oceanobacillus sp. Castelsardo]